MTGYFVTQGTRHTCILRVQILGLGVTGTLNLQILQGYMGTLGPQREIDYALYSLNTSSESIILHICHNRHTLMA